MTRRVLNLALLLHLTATAAVAQQQQGAARAPVAAKRPHVTQIHGRTLSDDYFWLRQRSDSDVVRHLRAENTYTDAMMKPSEALRQSLYDEMLRRIKQTDTTASLRQGDFHYFTRTETGKQYPIFIRRRVGTSADEVILDQNEMAKGHGFYAIGAFQVSDDGNAVAFTVDTTGYRQYMLRVKNLRTGKILGDATPRVTSVVWATDNKTLFLTTEDSITKRSDRFWRHTVGSVESSLLYDEKDELFDVFAERSLDHAMILFDVGRQDEHRGALPARRPADVVAQRGVAAATRA